MWGGFEDTVNGNIYWNITTKFISLLEEDGRNWFQQDGITSPSNRTSLKDLSGDF